MLSALIAANRPDKLKAVVSSARMRSARPSAGGMGEVYKARNTQLDRRAARQLLPADIAADPQARERFEREARAVGALNHPHICTRHDIGRHDPPPGSRPP